ncbi:TonB-dependent receptor [Stigmatella sp. ncwal1]|uniref:TonB-dependent receptor n=1 Tax=Stigmatella ashevillensis TaxID=2995309 RepID=A0ABT5DAU1_9BACT|nr:TonB-dependent receptor [Stigmatella ashevillena]MDC0710759.1 TonB-dependent receptor [Stigmatella ashevillena]
MGWPARAGLGVCLAFSISGSVRAQEAAGPPGSAEASADAPGVPVFSVPTVEVQASPETEPSDSAQQRDPSGALTVIQTADFGGAARDTAEVLSTAPGVAVQDSGGYGQSKSLVVRGASSNGTLVLLDGIPLNGAGGIADLSRVPLAVVERFEVLRGGAGARYGSGGLGGVVNVVTRRPGAEAQVAGEATYGSWNTVRGWVSATGPVLEGEALLLLHGGRSTGDFPFRFDASPALPGDALVERRRANNDAKGAGGLLRVRHGLGEAWELDAMAELSADDRGLAGTAQNPLPDARQGGGRVAASLRLSGERGPVRGSVRTWFRGDRIELSGGPLVTQGRQVLRLGGGEVEARTLLGERHGVSALLSVSAEDVTRAEGAPEGDSRPGWWRASAMVMDEISLAGERLSLAPSMRVERAGPYTLLSPKVGATVRLPEGFELRANVGQAHRAPSFQELYVRQGLLLPNPSLRPERVLSTDAAVVHRTERSLASVGGFYSLYEDLIAYELYPPFSAKPYNFASARAVGLEAEGEWRPFPWVAGAFSYTLLVSRNLRDDPRYYLKELPYRPRHKLSARASGGPRWLTGRVEVATQASQFINRTEEAVLPGRTFLHAGLSSTFGRFPELTVSLELKNLLDAQAEDLDGYPLPGRFAAVTVAASFGGPSRASSKGARTNTR